eukprot:scaffold9965_cov93-Isochrysis_galbana.AAC.1
MRPSAAATSLRPCAPKRPPLGRDLAPGAPLVDARLSAHAAEARALLTEQLRRRPGLDHRARLHDEDPVVVYNCVEPVRDGQNGGVPEMGPHRPLHRGVGVAVAVGGGLVHDEDAGVGQHGACQHQQLPGAGRQVEAAVGDLRVQGEAAAGQQVEVDLVEGLVQLGVADLELAPEPQPLP